MDRLDLVPVGCAALIVLFGVIVLLAGFGLVALLDARL